LTEKESPISDPLLPCHVLKSRLPDSSMLWTYPKYFGSCLAIAQHQAMTPVTLEITADRQSAKITDMSTMKSSGTCRSEVFNLFIVSIVFEIYTGN